jgi:hypothetical protein
MKTNLARVLRSSSEANLWTALIPNLAPLGLVITHEEIKRTLQEGGKLDLRVRAYSCLLNNSFLLSCHSHFS